SLAGKDFAAMDTARAHQFSFNEAISFVVNCENQNEIDHYWQLLSAHPRAEQCGWLKDKYGASWQIVPSIMGEMMTRGSADQIAPLQCATCYESAGAGNEVEHFGDRGVCPRGTDLAIGGAPAMHNSYTDIVLIVDVHKPELLVVVRLACSALQCCVNFASPDVHCRCSG